MALTIFDNMKFPPYEFREFPKMLTHPDAKPAHPSAPVEQTLVNDEDEEERVLNGWGYSRASYAEAMGTGRATVAMPSTMTAEQKLAAFLAANPDVQLPSNAAPPAAETDPLKMQFFSLQKFTLEKTGKKPATKDEALGLLREAGLIPAN